MGYTLTVVCKSKKAMNEMVPFMETHYRTFVQSLDDYNIRQRLCDIGMTPKEAENSYQAMKARDTTDIYAGKDLYIVQKQNIGFAFTASIIHHQWFYNWCCWMALKVGRHRRIDKMVTSENLPPMPRNRVPYILYDGYESDPVLQNFNYEGLDPKVAGYLQKYRNVDAVGFQASKDMDIKMNRMLWGYDKYDVSSVLDEILHSELKRLNALWEAKKFEGGQK